MGTLDVDDRREDLPEGDGDRDFAALGDNDRCTSDPGVDARELALLKGSDFARVLFRLRARGCQMCKVKLGRKTHIDLGGSKHLLGVQAWAAQNSPDVMVVQNRY